MYVAENSKAGCGEVVSLNYRILSPTLMMGHKLIWMTQVTPMIVVVLMTLIVTMLVSVTWFGPSQGVGCGVCAMFLRTPCT